MDFLITSEGDWLVAGSKEAEARIGYDDPDFDLTAFAVRNLGFVQVTWMSPTKVRVRFHPDQVASGALFGLKGRQSTFGDAGIEVDWLTSSWQSKQFTDAGAAIAHVDALASAATTLEPRYRATPQNLSVLDTGQEHPLKLLLQKWRVSFRRFSESVMPFAIQHGIFSRMMIVGVRKSAPDPVFRFIGDGFSNLYGDSFPVNAIGDRIENQPDKEYGAWVKPFYSDVAERKTPRLDLVEAVVPQFARGPWVRYQRLLLPWETPSGEIFVTLASATLAHGNPANDLVDAQAAVAAASESAGLASAGGSALPRRNDAKSSNISADDIRMSATSKSPQSEPGKRML
jgi:hypothetical protein